MALPRIDRDVPEGGPAAPAAHRAAALLTILLFTAVASAALVIGAEYAHYRTVVGWDGEALTPVERAAVAWLLWAKSLTPLLPLLVLAGLVRAAGAPRTARVLMVCGATCVFGWLLVDLWV